MIKSMNKSFSNDEIRLALGKALLDINNNVINDLPIQQRVRMNKLCLRLIAIALAELGIDKEI